MLRQKAECFFWYRPTRVVPEQRPVVVVVVVVSDTTKQMKHDGDVRHANIYA